MSEAGARRPKTSRDDVDVGLVLRTGGVIAALGGLLVALAPDGREAVLPLDGTVAALVVVLGFAVAERFAFYVEHRREAINFSLSEVPLAYGLLFLAPGQLLLARLVGATIGVALGHRPPPFKLAFNLAVFTLEVGLASAIFRGIAAPGGAVSGVTWAALFVAILVAMTVGGLVVSVAVASFAAGGRPRLPRRSGSGHLLHGVGAAVGTASVLPAMIDPWLAVGAAPPLAAMWGVICLHGRLGQRHRDLEAVHRFGRAVGDPVDVREVARAAVREAREQMRAEWAFVAVDDARGRPVTRFSDGPAPADETLPSDAEAWGPVAEGGPRAWSVEGETFREALVAPIGDELGRLGVLVVAERTGASDRFTHHERERFGTMAQLLAVSLRKGLLHERLEHEATHDRLTGLLNRPHLEERIERSLEAAGARATSVLWLDLDRFSEVNSTFGYAAGDRLLRECAERIAAALVPGDELARLGADEFGVLLPETDGAGALERARAIRRELERPFRIGELDISLAVSLGVSAAPDDTRDAVELLNQAGVAMRFAKRGVGGVERYAPEMRHGARLALLADLRGALERDELEVWFQPVTDLVSREVVGVEALIRWNHPARGWVPPPDLVGLAEQTGLIGKLTDRVLDHALRAVRSWHDLGYRLDLSVNLSPANLLDERLAERIEARLAEHRIQGSSLTLEITETFVVSDAPRTAALLDRVHALGCRISVDDFGTGYSSLMYLQRLPIDELKVDQSFVRDMGVDPSSEAIVRSTIDLGHNLGLRVVAEGIEQQATLERLAELGCDLGQGYGISRPLAGRRLTEWLATTSVRSADGVRAVEVRAGADNVTPLVLAHPRRDSGRTR